MAKGDAHALATAVAGGILSPALYFLGGVPAGQAAAFAAGCLAGLVINPDLDLRRFTHAQEVMRKSAGWLGGPLAGLWYAVWWPYARLIPAHRHPLSHLPLAGTAGRVLYLGLLLGLLYGLAGRLAPMPRLPWEALTSPTLWWSLAGLAAVDALHTLMDVI